MLPGVAVCLLAVLASWAQTTTAPVPASTVVRGVVVDASTSAPVSGAQISLVELNRTVQSSGDGRFEIAGVRPGAYTLTISMIGYIFVRREVTAGAATSDLRIPLSEGTGTYQETVTVAADRVPAATGVASQMVAGSAALQELRGVATDDPMRAMQALPGVVTNDDFQAEFSVRGAPFRHLGIVIDGTPSAVLIHSVRARENTGSIAMINTDVLEQAGLLAGPHPQRHGEWLGATLDFTMREGSRDRTTVRAAVSGTSTSGVLEGPLGRSKRGSWLVSLRKSYLDWLIRKIDPDIDSTIGFWDGQLKGVFDLTSHQQLQVTVIGGDASFQEARASVPNGLLRATSGSTLGSVAWRYLRGRSATTARASFLGSEFDNRGAVGQQLARGYTQSVVARVDHARPLGRSWSLDAGVGGEWSELNHILRDFAVTSGGGVRVREEQDESARWTVAGAWGQMGRRTTNGGIVAGARLSRRSGGADLGWSPWVLAERTIGGAWTARAGAGLAAQYLDPTLHTVTHAVDPERARFVDVSIEHRLTAAIRWQITAFGRRESDVLRRIAEDRVSPLTGMRVRASTFPSYRQSLKGEAAGVDLLLMRRSPTGLTGWIGYTWARSHYHDTASGEQFDSDFDQRHTLNVFAQQRVSYRLALSGKLRVGSNVPLVGYFDGTLDALRLGVRRNTIRLPRYVRLDLRASRTFTFDRRRLTLFVEVMNALGRDNYGQADGSIRANLEAVGYVERLIPRVPSAGLLIEF